MNLLQEPIAVAGDQEVLLVWLERSTHPADIAAEASGWTTHRVEAQHSGTVVGYLHVSYVTRESSYATMPDGLHFMASNRGWGLNFNDPKKLWCQAHHYASKTPLSLRSLPDPPAPRNLSPDDAPTLDVIESDLAPLHAAGELERKTFLQRLSTPFVAFARVDDGERTGTNWQRRGIARAMYRLAAQELGTRGLTLAASSLQSSHAEALWASFESDPQMPTRLEQVPGEKIFKTRLVLDYRNQADPA